MARQGKARTRQQSEAPAEPKEEKWPRYFVDVAVADSRRRSLALLIASRMCYACRQADDEQPGADADITQYVDRLEEHCAGTPDYLLPDTPLKEAIFRVILAGGNRPLAPEDISQVLSERWAMTPYPRDISPRVIQRMLDHIQSYCMTQVPQPSTEGSG